MAADADLVDLDATGQAALVRSGDVSPTELVQAAIDRAEAVNADINAIIHPRYERALEEAASVDRDAAFAGVPFVLKDLDGGAAGEPLHAGTRFLRDHDYVAPADDTLTARFRAAGLITIGRTNTPELGLVTTTEPLAHGASRNPWNLEHSTGGSSGGSAAAVAAGIVPAAHAGDGGGSIRIPASECGLVGLKPSRGRISMGPELGEAWAGLVARLAVTTSVRDAAALLDAVAGPGVGDPYWAPPPARPYADEVVASVETLRVGWTAQPPDGTFTTDPEVAAATEATAELLSSLGHQVSQAHPASLQSGAHTSHFLVAFSAWVARELDRLAEMVGAPLDEGGFEPGTWAIAQGGRDIAASDYLAAVDGLHAMTRQTVSWWADDGFDLLLTPTLGELPPTLGQFAATEDNPLAGVFRATPTVAFTAPFNITGQPAISLPLHQSQNGLPIGMQLVAAPAREDVLVRIAAQLEQAAPWADRKAPLRAR